MSLVRGSHSKSASSHRIQFAKSPGCLKRKTKRRPAWDSSVKDLSVYKATPEEIKRRTEIHKSNNLDLVENALLQKKIARARKKMKPRSNDSSSNHLLRELLYDKTQLSDVLSKHDKVMSVVKDLFGDDPKRFRGLPNVTVAPNNLQNGDSNQLPSLQPFELSKLDSLSESIMDQSALNDLEQQPLSDSEADDEGSGAINYRPTLDMNRFQRLLKEAETDWHKDDMSSFVSKNLASKVLQHLDQHQTGKQTVVELGETELDSMLESPKVRAINDTGKIKKFKSRINSTEEPQESKIKSATPQLDNLQKVLDCVSEKLASSRSGQTLPKSCPADPASTAHKSVPAEGASSSLTSSLSAGCLPDDGVNTSLVAALAQLTAYLTASDRQLKASSLVQSQLTDDVTSLRALVDALTSDIIASQEEYITLQTQFLEYRKETSHRIFLLEEKLGIPSFPLTKPSSEFCDQKSQSIPVDTAHPTTGNPSFPVHPVASQGFIPQDLSKPYVDKRPIQTNFSEMVKIDHKPESMVPLNPGLPKPNIRSVQDKGENHVVATLLSPPQQTDSPRQPDLNLKQVSALVDGSGSVAKQAEINRLLRELNLEGQVTVQLNNVVQNTEQTQSQDAVPNATDPTRLIQQKSAVVPLISNTKEPVADTKEPVADTREPVADTIEPVVSTRELVARLQPDIESRQVLHQQIAELNRQHVEAQSKLQSLLEQQSIASTKAGSNLSPSISPITVPTLSDRLSPQTTISVGNSDKFSDILAPKFPAKNNEVINTQFS